MAGQSCRIIVQPPPAEVTSPLKDAVKQQHELSASSLGKAREALAAVAASLLADVTRTLSDQHVNILSAAVSTSKDRTAFSRFTFEMADATHLDSVLTAVRSVEGVYDVYRN